MSLRNVTLDALAGLGATVVMTAAMRHPVTDFPRGPLSAPAARNRGRYGALAGAVAQPDITPRDERPIAKR